MIATPKGFISVACATPAISVGNIAHNVAACTQAVHEAHPAQIIVLPELSLTGATVQSLFEESSFCEHALLGVAELAKKTARIPAIIVVGAPLLAPVGLLNAAFVLYKGAIVGATAKKHLSPEERRYFVSAPSKEMHVGDVVLSPRLHVQAPNIAGFDLAPAFSSDPVPSASIVALLDATPYVAEKPIPTSLALQVASKRANNCILYANAGLGESTGSATYAAEKSVVEAGEIVEQSQAFAEHPIVTQINIARVRSQCKHVKHQTVVEVPLSLKKTPFTRSFSMTPYLETNVAQTTQQVLAIQAHGLAKRMERTHTEALVIGVSGGLDSACALLACTYVMQLLQLPPANIYAYSMPAASTTERTHTNAHALCNVLQVSFEEIPIDAAVSAHLQDISHPKDAKDVTFENAQARERTQILFDIANQKCALVVGTGDMSELALGFATYNGDLSSHYGINANVPKTLMQAMLKEVAATTQNEALSDVLRSICETPISPELIPGQRTEDILGPYVVHDFFMYHVLKNHFAPATLLAVATQAFTVQNARFSAEQIKTWLHTFYARFFANQFKRNVCADGPQVLDHTLVGASGFTIPADCDERPHLEHI